MDQQIETNKAAVTEIRFPLASYVIMIRSNEFTVRLNHLFYQADLLIMVFVASTRSKKYCPILIINPTLNPNNVSRVRSLTVRHLLQ
jgi:hypothetical protein